MKKRVKDEKDKNHYKKWMDTKKAPVNCLTQFTINWNACDLRQKEECMCCGVVME